MNSSKKEVIKFAKMLNDKKLSALRSGNISLRYKNGFLITPSGQKYSSLKDKDIVYINLDGEYNKNQNPSSEWRFHQDIYNSKKNAKAIVHSHSTNATALSTHNKKIPSFHYMVALAGGTDIKCAKYATYGTRELSKNILYALTLVLVPKNVTSSEKVVIPDTPKLSNSVCPSTSMLPFASILPVKVAVSVNSEVPATLKLVPFNNCKLSLLNLPVIT